MQFTETVPVTKNVEASTASEFTPDPEFLGRLYGALATNNPHNVFIPKDALMDSKGESKESVETRCAAMLKELSPRRLVEFVTVFPMPYNDLMKRAHELESHPIHQDVFRIIHRIRTEYTHDLGQHTIGGIITEIQKIFPYPDDFVASLQKFNVAKEAIDQVAYTYYGERYVAYQHIEYLKQAHTSQESIENVDVFAQEIERRKKKYEQRVENISPEQGAQILARTEIHGSDYKRKYLTPEILASEHLEPRHAYKLEKGMMYFSRPFTAHDRSVVIGYVDVNGTPVARTYYLSNSATSWRYLPRYRGNSEGDLNYFDKGHGEESVALPSELQKALSEIVVDHDNVEPVTDPALVFAGTARSYFNGQQDTYIGEVASIPRYLSSELFKDGDVKEDTLQHPLDLSLETTPLSEPDLDAQIATWTTNSKLYGPVTIELYPSKDLTLQYLFCCDKDGRLWISSIETIGDIQSTGLRREWVDGGNLGTPVSEYPEQASGYGNPKRWDEKYIDMYENYLAKIPLIRKFARKRYPESLRPLPFTDAKTMEQLITILKDRDELINQDGKKYNKDQITKQIDYIQGATTGLKGLEGLITNAEGLRDQYFKIIGGSKTTIPLRRPLTE